jgi:hypothetical protein
MPVPSPAAASTAALARMVFRLRVIVISVSCVLIPLRA